MMTHTKGPWKVESREDELIHAPRDYGRNNVIGAWPRICIWASSELVSDNPGLGGYREVALVHEEANAHLIAAAPELLKALRNLVPIGFNDGPLMKLYAKEIEAAEQAIAKAEGNE